MGEAPNHAVDYGAIFDAVNDAIFIHDSEHARISDVNEKACEMFCYPKEELVGLTIFDLIANEPGYTSDLGRALIDKAANGEPQMFEWIVKDKAGHFFWIEVNLRRAVIGGRYQLISVVRDINERKRMEDRLERISEAFLKFSVDTDENINSLTALAGELMGADCALYNRLEGKTLCSCGKWNIPEDFKDVDRADGHICYDIVRRGIDDVVVIRNLPETEYAKTDPNVLNYKLQTYIGRPVKFSGNIVGSLCVLYQYDIIPSDEDRKVMSVIASAIGVEEERKSAQEALLNREEQLEILSRTSQHINTILETDTILRTLVAAAIELVDAGGGMAGIYNADELVFKEYNKDGHLFPVDLRLKKGECGAGFAAEARKPYICNMVRDDMRVKADFREKFGIKNLISIPVVSSTGELLGCFEVHNKKEAAPFSTQDAFMLQGLAAGVAVALENARMVSEIRRSNEAVQESEQRFKDVVENAGDWVWEIDSAGRYSYASHAVEKVLGYTPDEMTGRYFFEFFAPAYGEETKKAALEAIARKEHFRNFVNTNLHKDGHEVVLETSGVPVVDKAGNLKGYRGVDHDITERIRSEKELAVLNKELMKSNETLKQIALKDPQTGLYNHHYLTEIAEAEFHRARRYANPLAVIMIDIDYFKSINDLYGHDFGDVVLNQLAQQLRGMVRRYDVVIRFGGEEFVIVSAGSDRAKSLIMANRIREAIEFYNFGDKEHLVKLKLSVGVAAYPDDDVVKALDLVALSEKVMEKVKQDGGNRVYSSLDLGKQERRKAPAAGKSNDLKFLQDKIARLTKRGREGLMESIFALAKTIEIRDRYTSEHAEETVHYASEVARQLKLSQDEIENIKEAAVLHDLGKIGISDKILLKKSKLTQSEYEEIKKHPQIAADIIRPIKFLHDIIPLILYHHERWDGKGYSSGLKGEEIPMGARIIAIADVYQALTSNRPYRKAFSKKSAAGIIKKEAGKQFDPIVVEALIKVLQKEKKI